MSMFKGIVSISTIIVICIVLFPLFDNKAETFTGCSSGGMPCNEINWGYSTGEFNQYSVHPTEITQTGIAYDPSGLPINPELIDRLTNEVETCLATAFPGGVIPLDVAAGSYCSATNFTLPFDRHSFVVKIASDWVLSCPDPVYGQQQLLPVSAGDSGCIAKGLAPSAQCPCRWRAGIECPNNLITTPSFYLYKDVLIRYMTGCGDPWAMVQFSTCAMPTTLPLSDGTGP